MILNEEQRQKVSSYDDFYDYVDMLKSDMDWYERSGFSNKIMHLGLDNGERLRVSFSLSSIAHLLGIQVEYLKSTGVYSKTATAYSIIKSIISNPIKIANLVACGYLTWDKFLSDFAFVKANSFCRMFSYLDDIKFICKYDKSSSYTTGYSALDGDYYVAYQYNDGLLIVGLKKDGEYYKPITNRYVSNDDKFLNVLLTNQVVTVPNYVYMYYLATNTYGNKFTIFQDKKIQMLADAKEYADTYQATCDVSLGYSYALGSLIRARNEKIAMKEAINCILQARPVTNFTDLPIELTQAIEEYNKSLHTQLGVVRERKEN